MEINSNVILKEYYSPAGNLIIGSYLDKICLCDWTCSRRHAVNMKKLKLLGNPDIKEGSSQAIELAINQFVQYFSGRRKVFDLPLTMIGTEFQKRVWRELELLQYGELVSYKDIAYRTGNPRAVRAVAAAIGANMISIIIPCHRVVGVDGQLTGYAGGLDTKKFLLDLECNRQRTIDDTPALYK